MFGLPFGKKKDDLPPIEQVMNEAMSLLQGGRPVDAEARVRRHVTDVETKFGRGNAKYSDAQAGYGALMRMQGKTDASLAAHKAAQEWEPPKSDSAARKDWLTFIANYGQVLENADLLSEAEQVLRRGLAGRLDYYGREHPGYAFGLEPLVMVLMKQERYAEALTAQEEVIDNFAGNRHPRFLQALVILGAARVGAGAAGPALAGFNASGSEPVEQMATEAPDLLSDLPNRIKQRVLLEIADLAAEHCGETHPARLKLLAAITNNAATGEEEEADHALRIASAEKLFRAFESQRDYKRAGEALLGLAYAQGDAGDVAAAGKSYERARIAGERLGDYSQASSAERNHGLLLSSHDRHSPEAEARLRNAVSLAERAGDLDFQGKAEGCLGIFYQHIDRLAEAEPWLNASVAHLSNSGSYSVTVRAHLTALKKGDSCGCDNMEETFFDSCCDAIREQVESEMPGLLEHISYEPDENGERSLQVRIGREPTEDELQRLHIVVTQAEAAFRQQVTQRH